MNNLQPFKTDIRTTAWDGLSENTRLAYQQDLMLFTKDYDLTKANPDIILKYINNLRKNGLKNATINRKVSSLSKFFKVQIAAGIRKDNPVEQLKSVSKVNFKVQRDVEIPLTIDDFKLLPKNKTSLIIKFLANTGLRISEFINIKNKDVSIFNDKYYKIRILGKNQKERFIYISKSLYNRTKENYPDNKIIDNLFYTIRNTPYSRKVLWKQIRDMFLQYTRKDIHPHQLRHYYVSTQINEYHRDIKAVSLAAGHSSVKITLDTYVHSKLKPEEFGINLGE